MLRVLLASAITTTSLACASSASPLPEPIVAASDPIEVSALPAASVDFALPEVAVPEVAVPEVAVPPGSPPFAPCETRTRSTPMLERYDQLVQGARFYMILQYDVDASEWTPSPALGMPLHHASALDFIDFTLPPQGTGTLVLDVEAVEIIRQAPRGRTFFVTYRVRVTSACTQG